MSHFRSEQFDQFHMHAHNMHTICTISNQLAQAMCSRNRRVHSDERNSERGIAFAKLYCIEVYERRVVVRAHFYIRIRIQKCMYTRECYNLF